MSNRATRSLLPSVFLLSLFAPLLGCEGAESPPAPAAVAAPQPCLAGEVALDDGRCQPAGLPPDMACPPGERPLPQGGCLPAGVPDDACSAGFRPDGDGGCDPILPAGACSPGQM